VQKLYNKFQWHTVSNFEGKTCIGAGRHALQVIRPLHAVSAKDS